jgi:cysteine desulfurase family protein (TIGR01976 family)
MAVTDRPYVAGVDRIRSAFPALRRAPGGRAVAYFDGPGGTQVPASVVEAMTDYLYHHNANTHWAFPSSQETDAMISAARQVLADFLNATPSEIVFGANMTTLTFHLGRALGRGWGPGDEIVITELDHHANVAPWQALAQERGVTVRRVPLAPTLDRLDWTALEAAVSKKTKLVAIGAASNALGTVTNVAAAARLAHSAGALCFVDAVHYAPHTLVDVRALDCDFLACSPYKFYGPHLGVLYGRDRLLAALDVPKLEPAPNEPPERMETGTQNHEGIIGAAAAVEFLASLADGPSRRARLQHAFAGLQERGETLLARLWNGLRDTSAVRLYGLPPGCPRTPTVSFTVTDRPSGFIARGLGERGVFVSHGDFYATTLVERLGQAGEGIVRAGCACYTTEEEVDRLIAGVRALV